MAAGPHVDRYLKRCADACETTLLFDDGEFVWMLLE